MLPACTKAILIFLLLLLSTLTNASRISPSLSALDKTYPIQPIEAAEILNKRIVTEANETGEQTTTVYVAIRINHKSAVDDYSQINVRYNDYYETLKLDFANVLTSDGKLIPVKKDAIQIQSQSNENFYTDTKNLAFSLPLTYEGSAIEFQYTIKDSRKKINNEFFESYSFSHWETAVSTQRYRADFTHFSEIIVTTPKTTKLHFQTSKAFNIKYKKEKSSSQISHTWSIRNIPSVTLQNYLPENIELTPSIDISTMKEWKKINQWASYLIEPKIKSNSTVKKIADRIREKTNNKLEQIKHVFNYMQENIRYVFAHLGRGGYEPHSTDNIVLNGYGDCKDQTILTIALLRELNINAFPALVSTSNISPPNKNIPQIRFDHMITYIPPQKELNEQWIDTVGGNFLYPGITATVNKQAALVIDKKSNLLKTVNNPYNKTNTIHFDINVSKLEKTSMKTIFNISFSGNIESEMRSWLRYNSNKKEKVNELLLSLYPKADIESTIIRNESDKNNNLSIESQLLFNFSSNNEKNLFGFIVNIFDISKIFSLVPSLDKPAERKHPLFIDYDHVISTKTIIEKPKGFIIDAQSRGNYVNTNKTYSYIQSVNNNEDNVTINQKLSIGKIDIGLSDYEETFKNIKNLDQAYTRLILAYDKKKSDIEDLNESISSRKNANDYISLIQLLIDNGEYDNALSKAKEAIMEYPKNGNIFYLKGLSHAYLGEDNLAEAAFKKSEGLGYEI